MALRTPATRRARSRGTRLRSRSEFRVTLQSGTRQQLDRVVVFVRSSGRGTRAGFVCGRQVGGAVARNRARRILKEAWRVVAPRVRDGQDIVFLARPAITGANRDDLVRDMEDALAAPGVMSP